MGKLAAVIEKELEGQRMEMGAREETAVQIQARDDTAQSGTPGEKWLDPGCILESPQDFPMVWVCVIG